MKNQNSGKHRKRRRSYARFNYFSSRQGMVQRHTGHGKRRLQRTRKSLKEGEEKKEESRKRGRRAGSEKEKEKKRRRRRRREGRDVEVRGGGSKNPCQRGSLSNKRNNNSNIHKTRRQAGGFCFLHLIGVDFPICPQHFERQRMLPPGARSPRPLDGVPFVQVPLCGAEEPQEHRGVRGVLVWKIHCFSRKTVCKRCCIIGGEYVYYIIMYAHIHLKCIQYTFVCLMSHDTTYPYTI